MSQPVGVRVLSWIVDSQPGFSGPSFDDCRVPAWTIVGSERGRLSGPSVDNCRVPAWTIVGSQIAGSPLLFYVTPGKTRLIDHGVHPVTFFDVSQFVCSDRFALGRGGNSTRATAESRLSSSNLFSERMIDGAGLLNFFLPNCIFRRRRARGRQNEFAIRQKL